MPFILHDYNGNIQTTQQLLVHEQVYFSFGRALFRTNKSIASVVKEIPKNRLFLETDTMNKGIETIYAQMSTLCEIEAHELKQTIFNNFQAIF